MIGTIALFEIRKRLCQISTYVYFSLFFALAFLVTIVAGGAFVSANLIVGGSGGKTLFNSPYVITVMTAMLSYFGLVVTAAITGNAVYQDFHYRTYPFFFTAPIRKLDYLLGRFLGAVAVLVGIFASIDLGIWIGSLMPFVEASQFGPNRLAAYVQPYLIIVVPNLIITGALFFSLGAILRKILPVYVTSVVLLIGYLIASVMAAKIEWKQMAALVDPFGMSAMELVTEYWTVSDRNTLSVPLEGPLLWNRVLWLGITALLFAFTTWRFRFVQGGDARQARVRPEVPFVVPSAAPIPIAKVRDYRAARLLPGLTWMSLRETVKNIYFAVIVLAGAMFMIVAAQTTGALYGTETYPVTATVIGIAGGSFSLFMLIIITFYSGELVWRERDAQVDQLMDVLPIPNWLPLIAKMLALILVQVLLLCVVLITCLAIQAFQGYFKFELGVYLKELFGIRLIYFALLSVLAITIQVLVNHKYLAHFIMILFYVTSSFLGALGFERLLYQYGATPGHVYSDMNGFGHFLRGIAWFDAYWAAFAVLLALLAQLFWVRGTDQTIRTRLKQARSRFSPGMTAALALFAFTFVGLGAYNFYNTEVLNTFKSSYAREAEAAAYEVNYKSLEIKAQPRVTDVDLAIDIDPPRRSARASGTMALVNKTDAPISTVYVEVAPELTIHHLTIGDVEASAKERGAMVFHTFEFASPILPAQSVPLAFDLEFENRGFQNGMGDTSIVYNGTFFNSGALPHIGYNPDRELSDDTTRKKHGLAPRERMADVHDLVARRNNYISNQADWISLDATVSTSPDQIAIVPGYLQREWLENGRRYFRYRTEGRILDFFSVLSARYEVRRDEWHGPVAFGRSPDAVDSPPDLVGEDEAVAIEIYYHPGHEYNVENMIQSIKDSLDYYTRSFGPYQHRQVRILEFPKYQSFAQSFPNTIPYSEAIGFVARVNPNDPDDIDYPYYITAHEIAHQWWAHQAIGGNVQGATMLSETMAQYSALMVMKRKYGPDQMRRFLRYELDRYLGGRAGERKKELPLAFNENQGYIHYEKGSLVMYALQDYLGEEKLNEAIREFLKSVAYQDPPYTNSLELVEHIRRITPDDLQYLIEDLFETITLYDNRALTATYKELASGRFEVRLSVAVKKVRADELGVETEVPLADLIDVGVLDDHGKSLILEKKRFDASPAEFTLEVGRRPAKAGIDPLNKLIDRRPDDNVIRIEKGIEVSN